MNTNPALPIAILVIVLCGFVMWAIIKPLLQGNPEYEEWLRDNNLTEDDVRNWHKDK